jgi:hypothetical protein
MIIEENRMIGVYIVYCVGLTHTRKFAKKFILSRQKYYGSTEEIQYNYIQSLTSYGMLI